MRVRLTVGFVFHLNKSKNNNKNTPTHNILLFYTPTYILAIVRTMVYTLNMTVKTGCEYSLPRHCSACMAYNNMYHWYLIIQWTPFYFDWLFFRPGCRKNSKIHAPNPLPPRVPKTQFMAPAAVAAAARPKATGNRSRNFFTPSIITRQWVFWVVLKRKKKKIHL